MSCLLPYFQHVLLRFMKDHETLQISNHCNFDQINLALVCIKEYIYNLYPLIQWVIRMIQNWLIWQLFQETCYKEPAHRSDLFMNQTFLVCCIFDVATWQHNAVERCCIITVCASPPPLLSYSDSIQTHL